MATDTRPADRAVDRVVGGLSILYLIGVAVQVTTRAASNVNQADFHDSLMTLAQDPGVYLTSMYASLVANAILVGLAAGLYAVLQRSHPNLALGGAFLMLAAAVVSLVAASAGLALASLAQDFAAATGDPASSYADNAQAVELIRELAGRTGFTLAALGLVNIGGLIAWGGQLPRWLGWLGILVGVMMLSIWSDAVPYLHRFGGGAYLLWLAITGGWLLIRGTAASPRSSSVASDLGRE